MIPKSGGRFSDKIMRKTSEGSSRIEPSSDWTPA